MKPTKYAALAIVPFGPRAAQTARGYLDGDEFVRAETFAGGQWIAAAGRWEIGRVLLIRFAQVAPEALPVRRGELSDAKRRYRAGERSCP